MAHSSENGTKYKTNTADLFLSLSALQKTRGLQSSSAQTLEFVGKETRGWWPAGGEGEPWWAGTRTLWRLQWEFQTPQAWQKPAVDRWWIEIAPAWRKATCLDLNKQEILQFLQQNLEKDNPRHWLKFLHLQYMVFCFFFFFLVSWFVRLFLRITKST